MSENANEHTYAGKTTCKMTDRGTPLKIIMDLKPVLTKALMFKISNNFLGFICVIFAFIHWMQ